MREKSVETMRKGMIILGLVSLVVFGTVAAGQARDRQMAGAAQRKAQEAQQSVLESAKLTDATNLTPNTAAVVPVPNQRLGNNPSSQPNNSAASNNQHPSTNANPNSLKNTTEQITNNAQKNVEKVQQGVDDLTRIWP